MRIKAVFKITPYILLLILLSACSSKTFNFSDGSSSQLSDYKGQWLLINYWAVWCKPCVTEIPELNQVNERENISVIGVNFDQLVGSQLNTQLTKLNIQFPILTQDPAALFSQKTPSALPATLVINPEGEFQTWLMGPQTVETIYNVLVPEPVSG